MLTGSIHCDLAAVRREQQRGRLANAITLAPPGARVLVYVGAIAPEPTAVDLLQRYAGRLCVEISGNSPAVVNRWLEAVNGPAMKAELW
jgi:hypothetical protein